MCLSHSLRKLIMATKKAISYIRVSTKEQAEEGYSLQAQDRLLKDYAQKHEMRIVKKFELPESARGQKDRKMFLEMLDYLGSNKDVTVLLCEKVDRLTRNFKDSVKIDAWLNENDERSLHFAKQNLCLTKNAKSYDKFQWDILIAMARQYSNNLSEEVRKGLSEKSEAGLYPGNKKLGYKTIGEAGKRIWVKDLESKDLPYIKRAFELMSTSSFSVKFLSEALYDEGWKTKDNRPIPKTTLHDLLIDPFYCGQFSWKGKVYEGKHEPLVTNEIFKIVQEKVTRKSNGKYRKHHHLYANGIFECAGCGHSICGQLQKGAIYYSCSRYDNKCTNRKYALEANLDKKVAELFGRLKITKPRLLEWVVKGLKETQSVQIDYREAVTNSLDEEHDRLQKRLDNLYDDKLDEKINEETYNRKYAQIKESMTKVLRDRKKHLESGFNYYELGSKIFELAQKGDKVYENLKIKQDKRDLINFVFLNLKFDGENIVPTYKNGFEVVAEVAKNDNWLGVRDSNPDNWDQNPESCR